MDVGDEVLVSGKRRARLIGWDVSVPPPPHPPARWAVIEHTDSHGRLLRYSVHESQVAPLDGEVQVW